MLRDRFSRWFADLELPELMRAIDPRLGGIPVLIRGEEGTGRTLLARYVHAFGGSADDLFVQVSCADITTADELLRQLRASGDASHSDAWTIWLEDVDRMPLALQRRIQDWIEFGVPDGTLGASRLRWVAGAGDASDLDAEPGLEPRLAEALSGLTIQIPPLRERPDCIEPFTADTTLAWSNAHGERLRRFSAEAILLLEAYPWPGNLHELEAVVTRTLSFSGADPLLPVHLRFPGDTGWLDEYDEARSQEPGRARETSANLIDEMDLPEATILSDLDEDPEEHHDGLVDDGQGPSPDADSAQPAPLEQPTGLPTPPAESSFDMATRAAHSVLPPAPEPRASDETGEARGSGRDDEDASERDLDLRRLVRAVAHEVRNPLVSIRTFSELLPEHYDDPEFRTHFRELVSQDVRRIDQAVTRLQNMVDMAALKSEPVDLAHMLETLLDERREEIQTRRLLVLKELDHNLPHVLGDARQLRDAFAGLLQRALSRVLDRGDIYLASKHHLSGLGGRPSVRVLLRHSTARSESSTEGRGVRAGSVSDDLDLVMAQTIVQALGGTLTADETEAAESVIVIDLPAPS
jgi:hypothetical protein